MGVVGTAVGRIVCGGGVGTWLGTAVGKLLGASDGAVVGESVGTIDGTAVGFGDGIWDGATVSISVGTLVGATVGPRDGATVGAVEGTLVGPIVGPRDGATVGPVEGTLVGPAVGIWDGDCVVVDGPGLLVGAEEGGASFSQQSSTSHRLHSVPTAPANLWQKASLARCTKPVHWGSTAQPAAQFARLSVPAIMLPPGCRWMLWPYPRGHTCANGPSPSPDPSASPDPESVSPDPSLPLDSPSCVVGHARVGVKVAGAELGRAVSAVMVGAGVVTMVGASVGIVVGAGVGTELGPEVGAVVGAGVGPDDGNKVGLGVGIPVDGALVGALVGNWVGVEDGLIVGGKGKRRISKLSVTLMPVLRPPPAM